MFIQSCNNQENKTTALPEGYKKYQGISNDCIYIPPPHGGERIHIHLGTTSNLNDGD